MPVPLELCHMSQHTCLNLHRVIGGYSIDAVCEPELHRRRERSTWLVKFFLNRASCGLSTVQMSAPVQPLTLKEKVKETPEQKAARKAAKATMTPEQHAAFAVEKEKLKANEAAEKAKLAAAKGLFLFCVFLVHVVFLHK